MGLSMLTIGFISLAHQPSAQGYSESTVYLLWFCFYELTVGPVAYIIVGEVSTTRLRSHTVGLARNAYNLIAIVNGVVGPYVLNPTEGNWKGKCGFITFGLICLFVVWSWFRLPEMRGRTYGELDILFDRKLGAREFSKATVEPVSESKQATLN